MLLEAFRSLPATTRLWIASDGPDGPRLRAEHAEDKRITWLGRISDAEKFARLRGATVFCAPSLHGESFGVVLIEAMAAGTPVVASGIDGYRNVATDGVDALLAEPGDVGGARRRPSAPCSTTSCSPSRCGRRATAGRQQFSMTTLAAEYVAIYRQLLDVDEPPARPLASRWLGTERIRDRYGARLPGAGPSV